MQGKGPKARVRFSVADFFFTIETLPIKSLKNGSDRLRKGKLRFRSGETMGTVDEFHLSGIMDLCCFNWNNLDSNTEKR